MLVLEGFDSTSIRKDDGTLVVDYFPVSAPASRSVRIAVTAEGSILAEVVEGRARPGAANGERVTCPVHTDELERRILCAMLSLHFGASWLEDGFTAVDKEMVSRGYDIGALATGELIWFRQENGSTLIVKRDGSDRLPGSYNDPARLVLIGPTGKELVVEATDYRSLVFFMEANAHYNLYQPHDNIRLTGVYSKGDVTVH